ncbi:MAG: DUF63 family protein [Halorientalis sp.]
MRASPLQVLPSGLVLPPLPYLLVLALGTLAAAAALVVVRPRVTDRTVLAATPWMVVGAALHALAQLDATPAVLGPLVTAPAVYLTTAVVGGGIWAAVTAAKRRRTDGLFGAAGLLLALAASAAVLATGARRGTLSLGLPVLGIALATVLAAAVSIGLERWKPDVPERLGAVTPVVVFAHALDGVSTAIGVDLLAVGERSPLPRLIMDIAGALPFAGQTGTGWLFVVVKLAIAVGILLLFVDMKAESPERTNAVLAVVAAVGLGPGAHNLLLFAAGSV